MEQLLNLEYIELFSLWEDRGLNDIYCTGGNLVAFLAFGLDGFGRQCNVLTMGAIH